MKVVLRKDVEKLGEKGSVQTVANGFGRNYLIPQGMAVLATEGELKVVAENARVHDLKIARQEKQLQTLADSISGRRIEFVARAGDGGRLYGSVTSADIAERLTSAVGQEIDRRKISLADPIRTVGEHIVSVHLVGKLRPQVTIVVIGEADEAEAGAGAEAVAAE